MSAFDPVAWLRGRAFADAGAGPRARVGAEIELLSLDAATGLPVTVSTRLQPFLVRWAEGRGGVARTGAKGGLRVHMPDGAAFAIEPGGQLEYASAPFDSPSALLRTLDHVLAPLTRDAAAAGITLLGAGIDPFNGPDDAPLQIAAERYCRMDAYFQSIGPAGRRMMRQTAAVQVNVDPAGAPEATWNALNAAAPFLTALLARSRRYAGRDTGVASFRAETWRRADPLRTGLFEACDDIVEAYGSFALNAPLMRPTPAGAYRPFRDWLAAGLADETDWAEHLTTLFPEIRPKRYLEVRCMDAQPIDDLALPVLMCAGIALDATATHQVRELLGLADPPLLWAAGSTGLAHPALRDRCRALVDIALAGCTRLGPRRCHPADIERAAGIAESRFRAELSATRR